MDNIETIKQKALERADAIIKKINKPGIDRNLFVRLLLAGLQPEMTPAEVDNLIAEQAASMMSYHPDYERIASYVTVIGIRAKVGRSFSSAFQRLYGFGMIDDGSDHFVFRYSAILDALIVHERDFKYSYFALKTLLKSYLLHDPKDEVAETPQYMLMRCAVGIRGADADINEVATTYDMLSRRFYTHATPTLFAAATTLPQLSSCYLLTIKDDSIRGIFQTVEDCAAISRMAGGIGLNIHDIRPRGSDIARTRGKAQGIVPMLRVFNEVARYVDQGGGRRKGSIAVYLEPWHPDIFDFLNLKKNHGAEEARARDLFYGLWIPDLFMQRVEDDEDWSLIDPRKIYPSSLADVWGNAFEAMYINIEENRPNCIVKRVKAREIWRAILESQVETGVPYIMFKDACNRKSNHQHLGTIRCSNLCTEIIQYSSRDETAVCNLASLSLPSFVVRDGKDGAATATFNLEQLRTVVGIVTRNLDRVIDVTHYPIPEARRSNLRHRPIGIGVQGLADVFCALGMEYGDADSRLLNIRIFENIYFAALEASCDLARKNGAHPSYKDSPISRGRLQMDMWDPLPGYVSELPWDELRQKIRKHGVRNSLLCAPMPTASTAQILGNTESFEPFGSNLYVRRVLSGEFQVINESLVRALEAAGLWNEEMRQRIVEGRGSVQGIEEIPAKIRALYRTVWEIPGRTIIEMAADRGRFIDQSQSLSMYMAEPNYSKLTSMHFSSWRAGLKTGMYYLRTKAAASALQFTVEKKKQPEKEKERTQFCELLGVSCVSCSS